MLDITSFQPIQLSDKSLFRKYFSDYPSSYCDFNFVNLIVWNDASGVSWQELDNRLYIYFSGIDALLFPVGSELTPLELYDLSADLQKNGKSGIITIVRPEYIEANRTELEKFFAIEHDLDYQDYVYLAEKLALLSGKKLQKKKNLVSQFKRQYPDFSVRSLTAADREICLELTETWTELNGDTDEYLAMELEAIKKTWEHFEELGVEGVLILVDNQAIAYTIFSWQSDDTAGVHFEKYNRNYKGCGQIINQETALILKERFKYINREQDLQMEGLKKAKMSYDPDQLLQAFSLRPLC